MKNTLGFVYILTNPSFKDDWVKIGKSSRPVDVRSKEYEDRPWSLSTFTTTFLPEEQQTPSRSCRGPKNFSYKGKPLHQIRIEKEK